jgi:hypothetical protein
VRANPERQRHLLHARSGGHRVPLAPSRIAPKTRKETMNGVWRSPVLKPKSVTRSGQRITTNTPNIISDRCAGTKNGRKRSCCDGRLPSGALEVTNSEVLDGVSFWEELVWKMSIGIWEYAR